MKEKCKNPCMCDTCYSARDREIAQMRTSLLAEIVKVLENKKLEYIDTTAKDILAGRGTITHTCAIEAKIEVLTDLITSLTEEK